MVAESRYGIFSFVFGKRNGEVSYRSTVQRYWSCYRALNSLSVLIMAYDFWFLELYVKQ